MQRGLRIRNCVCIELNNTKGRSNEDYVLQGYRNPSIGVHQLVFAVADGVSRSKLPDGTYPMQVEEFVEVGLCSGRHTMGYYVPASGAHLAAQTFCTSAVQKLWRTDKKFSYPKDLHAAFATANSAIKRLNDEHISSKLDYLVNDYFGTCAVIAVIRNSTLFYAYIGDCGLAVFGNDDRPRLISHNSVRTLEEYREGLDFSDESERIRFWRADLRNKPTGAQYLTYGVLTGEETAEAYVQYGHLLLQKGDMVLLYSDGAYPLALSGKLRTWLRSRQEEQVRMLLEYRPPSRDWSVYDYLSEIYSEEDAAASFAASLIRKGLVQENDDDKTLMVVTV